MAEPETPANEPVDLALAVEAIYPAARFRRADSYAALLRTWEDSRPIPSLDALHDAWAQIQMARQQAAQRRSRLIALRGENRDALRGDDYADLEPRLRTLARKLLWLEAELRDLRQLSE